MCERLSWRAISPLDVLDPHPAGMADTRAPRPSTDEGTQIWSSLVLVAMALLTPDVQYPEPETAPLLQNASHPDDTPVAPDEEPTFWQRVAAVVQEPLSPLTKVLLIATLVFLILSSIFIGLFAGAQHKLNTGGGGGGGGGSEVTTTVVVTSTAIETTTEKATTTAISTTTVSVPAPGPTAAPEEVRTVCSHPSALHSCDSYACSPSASPPLALTLHHLCSLV